MAIKMKASKKRVTTRSRRRRKPVRTKTIRRRLPTPANAQVFWQSVYDELLGTGEVTVPAVPKLTERRVKSLNNFGFILVYIPAITEEQYPEGFVKPEWLWNLIESEITRKPLEGKWVAVETIEKSNYNDGSTGYPDDRLMTAVKKKSRFNTSWDDLDQGLLTEIAKVTGFPRKGTRLPTAEEWNLIANLFNWLRENRGMNLSDLGSTRSWEWCENASDAGYRLLVGHSYRGELKEVNAALHDDRSDDIVFRILFDL